MNFQFTLFIDKCFQGSMYTLRKKRREEMVLQNGQMFYLKHFAFWNRLRDLQTMLSCEEP